MTDEHPVGKTCVVLTKKGKELVDIVGEPSPGFFQAANGSLFPEHSVRGVARLTIEEQDLEVTGE